MTEEKQIFEDYLRFLGLEDIDHLMARFEHYLHLLYNANRKVNLVSRNIPLERYWVQHFLDSIVALECLDFTDKTVLDFGSGGGLPGIPLKLAVPDFNLTLLDSVQKKARVLREFVDALSLSATNVEASRLEDYAYVAKRPSYDFIVCRAVALEERYFSPLRRLLKPSGMAVFYKAQKLDDVQVLKYEILLDKDYPALGQRQLIGIKQRDLLFH
ncbi:16S rRNA (guanine(527)-N(7))-methyltransferase RsmG [Candidatus Cloacimonas acidaminovorans]|nr:16S rRNA (guanine(527)-N(7))-methyltransferase RsmG [Candidatus Cloacimonas acidaminovorans]MDD3607139.1 16S rRNA (guanine(527)-N(7))-methyltransferase RsmG [Candidatus Cloacimonas acidaminovorans]NLM90690.1 16S rRNA (guanine(527)-N(7))-methyltransferase RsmG [Candidatus Cloacimonadota bacterium]